jgi:sterol desaturase/sphingolipid hydroxylase (fatty acid hydroxylase superfamily)
MEWIADIGSSWMLTAMWVGGLAAAFAVLVKLMPCNPGMYWWSDLRAVATDFVYWFVMPLGTRVLRWMMLVAGVSFFFGGRDPDFPTVRHLPIWQQCILMLVIEDVLLYWLHRLFHVGWAWKIHAVHHSPELVDWMSTARFHPINHLLEFALADTVVLLLGFSSEAFGVFCAFNLIYSSMVHANLNWTFGPFRYVLASPVFHRWHHTTEGAGRNKNFASTFPVLDVIFGTFYMPAGKLPERFGTGDADFPDGFWGQLLYPFRKTQPAQQLEHNIEHAGNPRRRRPATWKRATPARVPVSQQP